MRKHLPEGYWTEVYLQIAEIHRAKPGIDPTLAYAMARNNVDMEIGQAPLFPIPTLDPKPGETHVG